MKKLFSAVLIGFCAILTAKAEVNFAYEAGAEVVSSYLWRGQYNGGLSFQPYVSVGYEGEKTSFSFGAWGSVGASDWQLIGKQDGYQAYFLPELDLSLSFTFFNVTIGATHYYYFGGSRFFCWDKLANWDDDAVENNSSTTELQIGYNLADFLPENQNAYINWYTMIAGNDFVYGDDDAVEKRAYSSYLEIGYDYTFDNIGLTLGAQIGMVPWASDYYGTESSAVKNLSLKINKAWEFDACELDLFAQGMIDTHQLSKENAFIKANTGEKLYGQKLNGCIGLGIWF